MQYEWEKGKKWKTRGNEKELRKIENEVSITITIRIKLQNIVLKCEIFLAFSFEDLFYDRYIRCG